MAWLAAAAAVIGIVTQIGGMMAQGEQAGQQQRLNMATQKRDGGGPQPFTPTAQQFAVPPTPPSNPLLMREGYRPPQDFGASAPLVQMPQNGPQPSSLPPRLRETAFPTPPESTGATRPAAQPPPATGQKSSATSTLQDATMAVNMGQSLAQMFQMLQGQGAPPPPPRPQALPPTPFQPTAGQFAQQPRMQQMMAQQQPPGGNPFLQQQLQQQRLRQMYGGRY